MKSKGGSKLFELVSIDSVHPSSYNPRTADPRRLDLLELSIRKLGFIHPLYADENGELLSGHQRQFVSKRMGLTQLPVGRTAAMDLNTRKAVNIAFNRGTNDFNVQDTCKTLAAMLEAHDPVGLASRLADCPPEKFFRCMHPESVPLDELLAANVGRWIQYARNISCTLEGHGIILPIICTPDRKVVNGIGRLQLAGERKQPFVDVVTINEEEAAFANVMLNYLSMDFDIHTRYADLLRYNSFRRPSGVKKWLGQSFTFALVKSNACKTFDLSSSANRAKWIRQYGRTICDFGCGLMDETRIVRSIGVKSIPFEPYFLDANREICPPLARKIAREFLEEIASGVKFDSIFLSAVLNSVPFLEDRKHVICILAALCLPGTKVYAHAASDHSRNYLNANGADMVSRTANSQSKFNLDYEPRITIGELGAKPKVQKYHTPAEWYALWHEFFARVIVSESSTDVMCIADRPRPVSQERLVAALRHEFNLPYPDGSRMELTAEALEAFRKRSESTGKIFL